MSNMFSFLCSVGPSNQLVQCYFASFRPTHSSAILTCHCPVYILGNRDKCIWGWNRGAGKLPTLASTKQHWVSSFNIAKWWKYQKLKSRFRQVKVISLWPFWFKKFVWGNRCVKMVWLFWYYYSNIRCSTSPHPKISIHIQIPSNPLTAPWDGVFLYQSYLSWTLL